MSAVDALSDRILRRMTESERLGAVIAFDLGEEGRFTIDATGAVPRRDDAAAPEATLGADPATLEALLDGTLAPTAAYLSGRISGGGSMDVLLRLAALLDEG